MEAVRVWRRISEAGDGGGSVGRKTREPGFQCQYNKREVVVRYQVWCRDGSSTCDVESKQASCPTPSIYLDLAPSNPHSLSKPSPKTNARNKHPCSWQTPRRQRNRNNLLLPLSPNIPLFFPSPAVFSPCPPSLTAVTGLSSSQDCSGIAGTEGVTSSLSPLFRLQKLSTQPLVQNRLRTTRIQQ